MGDFLEFETTTTDEYGHRTRVFVRPAAILMVKESGSQRATLVLETRDYVTVLGTAEQVVERLDAASYDVCEVTPDTDAHKAAALELVGICMRSEPMEFGTGIEGTD